MTKPYFFKINRMSAPTTTQLNSQKPKKAKKNSTKRKIKKKVGEKKKKNK